MMTTAFEVTTGPLPVGQFVNMIRKTIKNDSLFQNQVIRGEITQWKQYPSGHTYFALRDDEGQISCVIWRDRCAISPLIKEGVEVIVIANLDIFTKRGQIQLIVNRIEPVNAMGALEEEKKRLINLLRKEGHLDRIRKPLPTIPKHLAIVTGSGSAALADMNRLIDDRWPNLRRTVIGVTVQGELACNQIVKGIIAANNLSKQKENPVDLIIVGRGGGSPEDLWAFNLEPVARAIIASQVPVVSAVGHESDLLVSDLVADLRASTPSNAIERCIPYYDQFQLQIANLDQRIEDAAKRIISDCFNSLALLDSKLRNAPLQGVFNAKQRVSSLESKMNTAIDNNFNRLRNHLTSSKNKVYNLVLTSVNHEKTKMAGYSSVLKSSHPKRVLERGYSLAMSKDGSIISSAKQVEIGDQITISLNDGLIESSVDKVSKGSE